MSRQILTPQNIAQILPVSQVRIGWITAVVWSPDGQTIAIAGGTQTKLFVRSFGATPTFTLEGHDAPVKDVAFSHNNDMLATVGADGQVIVWAIDGTPHKIHKFTVADALNCVAFSPDSRYLIVGSGKGDLYLWDLRENFHTALPYPHTDEVKAVKWRTGSVYSAGNDGKMLRRDISDMRSEPVTCALQDAWIRDFDLTADDRITYTVSKDGTLQGWSRAGALIFNFVAHQGGADCVAVHGKGLMLATGGRDSRVRIWDLQSLMPGVTPRLLAVLTGHDKPVLTLAFNPQGTMLMTGSGDNSARLWSVEERNNAGN